jgi:hypothetical protein
MRRSDMPKVHDTDIKTKQEYWPKFAELMANQFNHGGEKYALGGVDSKETTDWVCEICPGVTGADWILGTMAKYIGRFKNFRRERDILKIATYCFILWLKMGYHLEEHHDEDIKK